MFELKLLTTRAATNAVPNVRIDLRNRVTKVACFVATPNQFLESITIQNELFPRVDLLKSDEMGIHLTQVDTRYCGLR